MAVNMYQTVELERFLITSWLVQKLSFIEVGKSSFTNGIYQEHCKVGQVV